jgi:hypothetical protein
MTMANRLGVVAAYVAFAFVGAIVLGFSDEAKAR